MTIAGHGRIHHSYLHKPGRLVALAGGVPTEWGVLFVLEGDRRDTGETCQVAGQSLVRPR